MQEPLLFSGNASRELASEVAARMRTRLGNALVDKFRNDECRIEIKENVRGAEIFVFQSLSRAPGGNSVNDSLVELLLMIDAMRRASAYRITAVVPYYGYAKQDKKTKGREPISAKLVANMIAAAGARRVVTLDLHAAQIQGFFDLPVDNLEA
ncbi:MAG: ribose-phosphate diphosphokinase, partial [Candidatus Eremiobacteraeota bacterium]|nr:ribose-phosphate diphosphokinase [Candidatus Eremiobacteraeota bacterium]